MNESLLHQVPASIWCFQCPGFCHSKRCVVASYFCFQLASPWWQVMWITFSYAPLPSVYLMRCLLGLLPIFLIDMFIFLLSFKSWALFWLTVLYQIHLLQMFSPVGGLSSHSLTVSFPEIFHFHVPRCFRFMYPELKALFPTVQGSHLLYQLVIEPWFFCSLVIARDLALLLSLVFTWAFSPLLLSKYLFAFGLCLLPSAFLLSFEGAF